MSDQPKSVITNCELVSTGRGGIGITRDGGLSVTDCFIAPRPSVGRFARWLILRRNRRLATLAFKAKDEEATA